MKLKGKSYLFWCGLVVIFLLALAPRVDYPVSRYTLWYSRSVQFWDALLSGNWQNTFQRSHPGVTTMWIAGLGMRLQMVAQDGTLSGLYHSPPLEASPQAPTSRAGVAAISAVVAACIALAYVLLSRLAGGRMAFIGGSLLALDPFYIMHSKLIHVDGLLASFMLVSALFLLVYLREHRWRWLILSGMFAGLSLLTKSPSLFLVPFTGLVVTLHYVLDGQILKKVTDARQWGQVVWNVARTLMVWGVAAACTFVLLWPAMWVEAGKILSMMAQQVLTHTRVAHPAPHFFAGQLVRDPGLPYYLAALAWKTTPITLPALGAALVFLVWRRKHSAEFRFSWYMLIYAVCFLVMMTLGAKKWDRYILPVFLAVDVLAAWGIAQVAGWVERRQPMRAWVPSAIVGAAVVVQAGLVLPYHPYYGASYNWLLGGAPVAQHVLDLGYEGEGLDIAARFLNGLPAAQQMLVGVQDTSNDMFRENFIGQVRTIDDPAATYRVFYINNNQRTPDAGDWKELWDECQRAGPVRVISFATVPYVWICRAFPTDPDAFVIDHRIDAQLGDHIRLLGYTLSAPELSSGGALTVTLFWQSDGQAAKDYHVFVHLLDQSGALVTQHDGVPVQEKRPVWSWQEIEVLQDAHVLAANDLPGGVYTLAVGMYDYESGERLPARLDGQPAPDNALVLQTLEVNK